MICGRIDKIKLIHFGIRGKVGFIGGSFYVGDNPFDKFVMLLQALFGERDERLFLRSPSRRLSA